MKKRIISCILVLILILTSGTSVLAAEIVEDNVETAIENGYALLTNENGDVYYVKLDEEAVTVQSKTPSNDELSVTKSVTISSDNIIPAATTKSNSEEAWDSTSSIKAYTTINYKEDGTPTTYLLTSVSGGFEYYDLDVDVTNQKLIMACKGPFPSYTDQKVTKYPSSTSFWYSTGFTDYVNTYIAEIGASYTLTIERNGSSWTLILLNSLTADEYCKMNRWLV